MCSGRQRPPGDAGRHELILLSVAEEITTTEHGQWVGPEYVVGSNVDGIGNVVAPPGVAVLGNCVATTFMLENIAVDNRLIGGIAANLDRLSMRHHWDWYSKIA